jgi:hypothetical protein
MENTDIEVITKTNPRNNDTDIKDTTVSLAREIAAAVRPILKKHNRKLGKISLSGLGL